MKIRCIAATLAVTLLSATTLQIVSAQERPERGNREQRGGPGGPGGRFGGAGGPGGPGGGFGGAMGMGARAVADIDRLMVQLIGRQEVQDELELLPDQVDGLAKMNERLRGERPDFDFRNATEEQRNQFVAKMQEQQAERTKQAKDQLEELLLPDQFDRLEQIAVQIGGAPALVSPAMSERLGLTKEVTDKMTKEIEASAEKGREMMNAAMRDRDRGFDFNAFREKAEEMRKELDVQLLANLSDDQKAKYEAMKGKPFDLPGGLMGRGGFGGQPGAGGARGRGQGGPGAADGPGGRGGFGGRGGPGAGGREGGRPPQN